MTCYKCTICGYVYDPEEGDPAYDVDAGTPFVSIPEDWICPVCGVSIDLFEELET
jgi:rubredoxin